MPSSTSRLGWHDRRRTAALWIGLLAGPVIWFTALEANYVMSYVACEVSHRWFLHAVNVASMVVVAGAGWISWRHGPADGSAPPTPPVSSETSETCGRWMSIAGVGLSLWFILVILAMEIPVVLATCEVG
jgi:zinc transporter ZupT